VEISPINDVLLKFSGKKAFYYGSTSYFKYQKVPIKVYKILTDLNIAELGQMFHGLKFDSNYSSGCFLVLKNCIIVTFKTMEIEKKSNYDYLKQISKENPFMDFFYSPDEDKFYSFGSIKNKYKRINIYELSIEDLLDLSLVLSEKEIIIEEISGKLEIDSFVVESFIPLLENVLTSANPYNALVFMNKIGILEMFFPFLEKFHGIHQDRTLHPEGDVFEHTLHCFQFVKNPSLSLAFGLLLHDYGKSVPSKRKGFGEHSTLGANMIKKILKNYNFDGKFISDVEFLVNYHMVNSYFYRISDADRKYIFNSELGVELMKLYKADTLGSVGKLDIYHDIVSKLKKDKNIKTFR